MSEIYSFLGYWGIVAAMGFAIGVLSGCFGAGGGFLLTPALNIFLRLPMNLAIGTSALQITCTSCLVLWRHGFHWKMFGTRLAAIIGSGIPVGSWLGGCIVNILKNETPETLDKTLMSVYIIFLFFTGAWLVYDNFHPRIVATDPPGLLRNWRIPPLTQFRCLDNKLFSIPVLAINAVGLGFLSGMLGIGGGVVMLPLLVYLVGVKADHAAKISSMLVLVSGLSSTVFHAASSNIDYTLAAVLLVGALLGTQIGVKLQKQLPNHALLGWFGVVVLLTWVGITLRLLMLSGVF